MEKNDKQIIEKQIHSCSRASLARPNTVIVTCEFPVCWTRKTDSFHKGLSATVTESWAHTKETQMKEACSGDTEKEILLAFHAHLAVWEVTAGLSSLKSWAIKWSYFRSYSFTSPDALYETVTWLSLAVLSFPVA